MDESLLDKRDIRTRVHDESLSNKYIGLPKILCIKPYYYGIACQLILLILSKSMKYECMLEISINNPFQEMSDESLS